ncbi:MAG TPA: DUF1207 domain-containing protein [Candidatus Kapabacteria bacterium]|nr:DUF1207 domain-containing protein [Candidatus Kapabacteria bacterium]
MKHVVLLALPILLLGAGNASSQHVWFLENRTYFDPVIAETRAATVKACLGLLGEYPYAEQPGERLGMDLSVGKEIGFIGLETAAPTGPPAAGEWGAGIWLPVSFHMLWDLRDRSQPIINNDYRFGAMIKGVYGITNSSRIALRLVPWAHESTHLGDEVVLSARRRLGRGFERINVSYEFWEAALSYEGDGCASEGSPGRYKLRAGFTGLHTGYGYYYADPLEVNGAVITPSAARGEPFAELEWVLPTEVFAGWQPIISLDARNRIIYDYHKADPAQPEQRKVSIDAALGITRTQTMFGSTGNASLYLRLYRGVNPHGQLRSQSSFFITALGLNITV